MTVQSRNKWGVIWRHFRINKPKMYIYANFDPINKLILHQNQGIT
jgi:hypothetical protein